MSPRHLAMLDAAMQWGATSSSNSLGRWLERDSLVELSSLEQLPLADATFALSSGEQPICFCSVVIQGDLGGIMALAFDDTDGFALCDMLLNQPLGSTTEWNELAVSAVLETSNIVCCGFLNALSDTMSGPETSLNLLPTPPQFCRDYPESLMQFALIGQAIASDQVLISKTVFHIDGSPWRGTLLFAPDAPTMARLPSILDQAQQ